jgi:HlyD family secretion protein
MNKNKLIIIITIIVVIALLGTSAYMMFGGGSNNKSNNAQMPSMYNNKSKTVDIDKVTVGDVSKSVSGQGAIRTSEIKNIIAPVKCKVKNIDVKAGSLVKKGDKLFSFDEEELTKEYEASKRALQKKLKKLGSTAPSSDYITVRSPKAGKIAKVNLKKKKSISQLLKSSDSLIVIKDSDGNVINLDIPKSGTISYIKSSIKANKKVSKGSSLFTVKVPSNNYDDCLKEVEEAKEYVMLLEKYIENPHVYAQIDGIVNEVEKVVGKQSEKGTDVLSVQTQKGYMINIKIIQEELESVFLGQEAEISFGQRGKFKGTVNHINYIAKDDGSYEIGIIINNLDESKHSLYPGMKGKVTVFLQKKENVLRVPVEALKQDSKGEYVMVYNGESDDVSEMNPSEIPMEKKYVERGITNSMYAEIVSGVKKGEKVVVVKTSNNNDFMNGFGSPGVALVEMG